MMLPSAVYESRQMAKAKKNMADMRDFDKQKTDMVNATAAGSAGKPGITSISMSGRWGGCRPRTSGSR
jgi:hypothetical protein